MTGRAAGEDSPPELLKTSEVTRLLGVSRSTVLSWAYRGLLNYTTTPGGHLRFSLPQIEAIWAAGQDRPDGTLLEQRSEK